MKRASHPICRWPLSVFAILSSLCWVAACASVADQHQWIEVGKTTKSEVVAQYGEPDLLQTTSAGAVATYRPTASKHPSPAVSVPTVQPGLFGTTVTKPQPIDRPFGKDDSETGKHERIEREMHIRYDERGIVQEVSE